MPNEAVVDFPEIGEAVFLRARSWGLGGNHQEIILATAPIDDEHSADLRDRQIVYSDTTEIYYRKVGTDTLMIRADMLEEVPAGFSPKIKIKQSEFTTVAEAQYFAEHFKDEEFEKISVYPVMR